MIITFCNIPCVIALVILEVNKNGMFPKKNSIF